MFIFLDKTRKWCENKKENYNKLLTENIPKTYKKTTNNSYSNLYKEAKAITNNYDTANRADCLLTTGAFIYFDNH